MAMHPTAVLALDPNEVEIAKRVGIFWPEKAEAFAALILKDGQRDPIKVRRNGNQAAKPWRLVAGLHRLEGVKLAGIEAVLALEVEGDAATLIAIETSENVHRRDLGPIERAMHVHALAEAHRELAGVGGMSPQQAAIRARWNKVRTSPILSVEEKAKVEAADTSATMADVYGWQEDAAYGLGLSVRSLQRYLTIHRGVVCPFPELAELFARTSLGQQLRVVERIAAIAGEDARRRVIEVAIADPVMSTLDEALVRAELRKAERSSGDNVSRSAVFRGWGKLSFGERIAALPEFVQMLKPSERAEILRLLQNGED